MTNVCLNAVCRFDWWIFCYFFKAICQLKIVEALGPFEIDGQLPSHRGKDQIVLNGLRPTFTAWDKHRNPRPAKILGNYSIRSEKEVKRKFSILCWTTTNLEWRTVVKVFFIPPLPNELISVLIFGLNSLFGVFGESELFRFCFIYFEFIVGC